MRRPRSLNRLKRRAVYGVRRTLDRGFVPALNGAVFLLEGRSRPAMGSTPKVTVMQDDKLRLQRVRPMHSGPKPAKASPPVILIPPLMVRPYVYDLRPEHSMVRTLRDAGVDTFVVDFGVPDKTDEHIRLDDYVLNYVPRCVDAALEASGADQVYLLGYCMGGLFAVLHVATHRDDRIAGLITIGAPIDFDEMGILSVAGRLGVVILDQLMDQLGNVPGELSSLGFKLMGGHRSVTKYVDLLLNLYDESYVRGFGSVNTWVNDLIPYPKEAFKQMVRDFVSGNKLASGELQFDGHSSDLHAVRCPLLAFAGESDNIATPRSTKRIIDLVGSADRSFHSVPGGHIGVIAGGRSPDTVWKPIVAWLEARGAAQGV